jgi:hypothetical protein
MIVTEFYNGQGLGNQLWCYFVLRSIAHHKGYDFGVQSPYKFKGKEFIEIDFGKDVSGGEGPEGGPPNTLPVNIKNYYREKTNHHSNGIDISKIDLNLMEIEDDTKIDGCMQSINYFKNNKSLIKEWFKITKKIDTEYFDKNNFCIIHIRGGDFRHSSAFLDKKYYDDAISYMLKKNSQMNFFIITDDIYYSKSIFPEIPIIGAGSMNIPDSFKATHHIGGPIWIDWLILHFCKNVILSASSFSFFPVYLNENVANVVAPMYWGDYNKSDGYWSRHDMIVEGWEYLDRNCEILDSKDCLNKLKQYEDKNFSFWK